MRGGANLGKPWRHCGVDCERCRGVQRQRIRRKVCAHVLVELGEKHHVQQWWDAEVRLTLAWYRTERPSPSQRSRKLCRDRHDITHS